MALVQALVPADAVSALVLNFRCRHLDDACDEAFPSLAIELRESALFGGRNGSARQGVFPI